MNINYFFMKDQVDNKNIEIKYCLTESMTSDYMTKPLVGEKFYHFKSDIMNITSLQIRYYEYTKTSVE